MIISVTLYPYPTFYSLSVNLLFVCSECRLRSPTAEAVFSEYDGLEALAAGTNHDAETPLTGDLIEWADLILVMESTHRNKINKKFGALLRGKRLVLLNIPDKYHYMQAELVQLLKARVEKHLSNL